MYDDWAYAGIVTDLQASQRRPRSESLVKKIVELHDIPFVDYASLRPRRKSVPFVHEPPSLDLDFPLSKHEKFRLWNAENWAPAAPDVDSPLPTLQSDLAAAYLSVLQADALQLVSDIDATHNELTDLCDALETLNMRSIAATTHEQKLSNLYNATSNALQVYDNLEAATRTLNRPGTRAVTSSTFPQLLKNLEEGHKFCLAHPDFIDMDLYELRHTQCISRAHALVLEYCTTLWNGSQQSITPKLQGASKVTAEALLWPKFAADTAKTQDILKHLDSDSQIFLELQRAYSRVRTQLLATQVNNLATDSFSASLSYLRDLIVKEKEMWRDTFGSNAGFNEYSVQFSEPLYIELRGRIVHEMSINALCDIIMLLQDDESPVAAEVYKDAQNRLLFRADQIVDQILSARVTVKDLRAEKFSYVHETLALLSQIYDLMNMTVFHEFAHQSIRQCMLALRGINATELLGAVEGHLFHIRQLVALQRGVMEYDLAQIKSPQVDFSGLGQLVHTVRTTPRTLLSFEKFINSMPQVVEQLYDSIQELHAELQVVVQQFTSSCVDELLGAVSKRDPRTAINDTRVLRETVPKIIDRILSMANKHIQDEKIVEALMDSVIDAFVEAYAEYHSSIYASGTSEQLQGVLDPEAFVSWLAHTRETAAHGRQ